mmetsp:Transcript_40859/g.123124  ORF Transcript_40859/g.123124 Transcript_40859/m.123124 type:complete len:237 (-) Transcript_40859:379-1089(-)
MRSSSVPAKTGDSKSTTSDLPGFSFPLFTGRTQHSAQPGSSEGLSSLKSLSSAARVSFAHSCLRASHHVLPTPQLPPSEAGCHRYHRSPAYLTPLTFMPLPGVGRRRRVSWGQLAGSRCGGGTLLAPAFLPAALPPFLGRVEQKGHGGRDGRTSTSTVRETDAAIGGGDAGGHCRASAAGGFCTGGVERADLAPCTRGSVPSSQGGLDDDDDGGGGRYDAPLERRTGSSSGGQASP